DDFAIGYGLTEALISLGHRHIAIICSQVDCTSVRDRLVGHQQALKAAGLALEPELVALRPYTSLPVDERRARLRTWLDGSYRPTAYLTVNSDVGLAIVTSDLIALGVRIPEEATMASMDNANFDVIR